MREAQASYATFKRIIRTGFAFQKRKTALLRNHSSESKKLVLFVEEMKIWTSALWFEVGDATTHSIANALNAGFLSAEKEDVLLVERTMMKVDDFKM